MSRLPQVADDLATRLRETERRLAELEAQPRTGVIAAQTPLTTSSATWSADATTDHAIPDVSAVSALRYIVRLHTPFVITGAGRWLVNFHVDGTLVDRLDDIDYAATHNGVINAALEWLPPTGIFDVDVRVDEVADGSTLGFAAAATATRQFWIEAAGRR